MRTGRQGLPLTGGEVGLGREEQQLMWERTEFELPITIQVAMWNRELD